LSGPATDAIPVVPTDNTDLPNVALALYVETGGVINLTTVAGENRTITVTDFCILPVGTTRVFNTGTTATGIHALTVS
jgi:hypothetical protein